MDSDGDPHPRTPGDPHLPLHPQTPASSNPPEKLSRARKIARREERKAALARTNPTDEQTRQARRSRRDMKKARKEAREAAALEVEQGPVELQKEDPQISPPGALATGSHGHPETPAPAPTNPPEEQTRQARQSRRARKKAMKEAVRRRLGIPEPSEAAALELEHGPSELQKEDPETPQVRPITAGSLSPPAALATGTPESSAHVTQHLGESLEPERTRLRHSFLYSDRPRRSKRSTRVEEHVGEVVSIREFEALTLDQSPPTPDSAHRVKKHDSEVSNRELEARKLHQSPLTHSTPSIEEYALEVRALKLAQSPPTLDSTHRSKECAYDTTKSETGSEIVEEKPENESGPWFYTPACFDIVEALIAHAHGYSNPAQHKRDAQAFWESGNIFRAPEVSESLASLTENPAQGEASRKEIIENGMKWMGKEVMLAFEQYIEGKRHFKDILYCFDEIQHQCFNVESYNHTFHHFNFTVKTKKHSDADWSLVSFFAEVKELYGRKYYSCYELSSYDDGRCYACKNQGMDALQHPICEIGYEGGHGAMGLPFVYLEDEDYFD